MRNATELSSPLICHSEKVDKAFFILKEHFNFNNFNNFKLNYGFMLKVCKMRAPHNEMAGKTIRMTQLR